LKSFCIGARLQTCRNRSTTTWALKALVFAVPCPDTPHSRYARPRQRSLLFVVDRDSRDLLALRVSPARGDGTTFAIGRHHNASGANNLASFLADALQCATVNLFVRPLVVIRIAGEGVEFAVEFARPLDVQGLTVSGSAFYCDFHLVARRLVDNRLVFRRSGSELRFGLVQLPGAHIDVAGEAPRRGDKAQRHGQCNRSGFHSLS